MDAQTVTLDEVWRLFRETDMKFRETAERFRETDRKFQETDRRFKDLEQRFKETRDFIEELSRNWERESRQLNQRMGRVTDTLGHFAESMVQPALVRLFRERGIPVNHTASNLVCMEPGLEMEVDLVAVNDEYAVVVEVKTTLRVDDVNEHLERLSRFKAAFPMYRDKQVLGAVAGMNVPREVGRYAYKKGLYVLAQSGETVQILNDENFRPRVW